MFVPQCTKPRLKPVCKLLVTAYSPVHFNIYIFE
jgi:hypothetical protein